MNATVLYLCLKLLYVLNCFGQLVVLNRFLGGQYHSWAWEVWSLFGGTFDFAFSADFDWFAPGRGMARIGGVPTRHPLRFLHPPIGQSSAAHRPVRDHAQLDQREVGPFSCIQIIPPPNQTLFFPALLVPANRFRHIGQLSLLPGHAHAAQSAHFIRQEKH